MSIQLIYGFNESLILLSVISNIFLFYLRKINSPLFEPEIIISSNYFKASSI